MMGRGVLVVLALGGALAAPPAASASEPSLPEPTDVVTALVRQVCDLAWIDGACEASAYPDPGYATDRDPSPSRPLELRIGVVHEHSGYSDGDPDTRPSDYFRAARDGHNEADGGGDTGVRVDFLLSSEHSENEKLPITTAAACIDTSGIEDALASLDIEGIVPPLRCSNIDQPDHYRKWTETLAQAEDATVVDSSGEHVGFTAMRGFEWTNDYYNHLGVYFSRNVVNAKIDGSYLSMDVMWDWLREPAARGGGDDALVVFNHPGGLPALTPFDGSLPHNELLQQLRGGANWNDVAHVPDVDARVAGIEVNGGDDLAWYVRALTNGWHIGPVAAEDEHEREWSSSAEGKTLMLTRGRSPSDYYFALQNHRTIALDGSLVDGLPGEPATHPTIHLYADGASVHDEAATVLGSTITDGRSHTLHLDAGGLPPGSPAVLVGPGGALVPLDPAAPDGVIDERHAVASPTAGETWWFAVICPPGTTDCGTGESYSAVTAPIWLRAAATAAPAVGTPANGLAFQLLRPELVRAVA